MNELEKALVSDGYAAPPSHILEGIGADLAHRNVAGAPHTIYEELWHITFWQKISLDWVKGIETPHPAQPSAGFPSQVDMERESWDQLCRRFLDGSQKAGVMTRDAVKIEQVVRCSSRPGAAVRMMSVREQLENLAAHNAYHLGRIVLLRQLCQAWPPPSGGFRW